MLYGIAGVRFSFFLISFFSRHDFVRAISMEPLLAEILSLVCYLVLRSNCALLLTIQFDLLFFFLLLFFRQDFVRAISLEPLLAETPNWVWCLVLRSYFTLLLTIQFTSLFYLFFFSATILSGPYLWNRYSQRLQIECAAWSCGLILHCCLPSNSLCYFFFQFFFRHDFVRAISLEPLLAETLNWVCCFVLQSNFALLLTTQFTSLFFFPQRFRNDFFRRRVFHLWGIAPRSHTGRPRTFLIIIITYILRGYCMLLEIVFVGHCEVFVFSLIWYMLFFSLGREAHRTANGVSVL